MSKPLLLKELRETVFEYMEPSFRFHLSLHLPSLRSVEKRTYLQINKLDLTDTVIICDNTAYRLNIDLKFKEEKPPLIISGPISRDVDEFGFKTSTKDIMMNGDVCMKWQGMDLHKLKNHKNPKFSLKFHLSLHLPSLRSVEKGTYLQINKLDLTDTEIICDNTAYRLNIDLKFKEEKPPLIISGPICRDVDEFGFKTSTKDIMMNGDVCMENNSTRDMETSEMGRETLGLTEAMKKKEPPEFESTLELTITSKNGEMRIYTSSKITKIYEGMKMLIGVIFGNRTVIWNVESMAIWAPNLRWIVSGVKPLTRNIEIRGDNYVNLDDLRSICHETSFPLKTLGFGMDQRNLDHEIVVNAEHLIFYSAFEMFNIDFMNQLMKLPNLKVQLFRIPADCFAYLMDLWLKQGRPIGTSWSIEVEELAGEEKFRYIDILKGNTDVIESDQRFHLSLQLPSLCSVEKGAHLKINKLIFEDNEIIVNDTSYKLSIERKYKDQKLQLRKSGSVDHDVNEFGRKANTEDILMNGDVCMEKDKESAARWRNMLNHRIKELQTGWTFRGPLEKKSCPKEENEEPSECEFTLKLATTSRNGEMRIYRSSKITKIYEGMKILIGALFGNRTVIWNVESMIISTANLRWIVTGVRPLVRKVEVQGMYRSTNLDGLRSICHGTSFPLKGLHIERDDKVVDHEIFVKAEYLIVSSRSYSSENVHLLNKISNQKIQLFPIPENTLAGLMDVWLEHGRPVGTSWSFEVDGPAEEEPVGYIDILRGNARVIESDSCSIKMAMSPSSTLSVYYGNPIRYYRFTNRRKWTVTMEVLQRRGC